MIQQIILAISPPLGIALSGGHLFFVLSILGFMVGVVAGLFGVGGGFLLVPLLNTFLGIPVDIAAGSATCYIIGTSASGIKKHLKNKNVEIRAALFLSFGSMLGAVGGDILQNFLIETAARGNRVVFEKIMQIIFVVLLLLIAWVMYYNPEKKIPGKLLLQKFKFGPVIDLPMSNRENISVIGLFLIGFLGGILTGLMGVSGGVLFMPILVIGVGLLPHLAVGTSLTVVFIASVSAVIKKGVTGAGKISLPVAISLLIAGTLGVRIGIILGSKLSGKNIKKYFSLVALAAAIMVLVKLFF